MNRPNPWRGLAALGPPLIAIGLAAEGPTAHAPEARAAVPTDSSRPTIDDPFGLGWAVGEWEGEGWMQLGPERRETFRQLESVRTVLGGRGLLFQGTAFAIVDDRVLEELGPVHEALAVLTRAPDAGNLTFRAYRSDGEGTQAVDAWAEEADGTFTWGFRDPAFGEMRYTIVRTADDEWHETGRISPDGERWFDFLEMTLRRVEGANPITPSGAARPGRAPA